jgi:hypothetical protein
VRIPPLMGAKGGCRDGLGVYIPLTPLKGGIVMSLNDGAPANFYPDDAGMIRILPEGNAAALISIWAGTKENVRRCTLLHEIQPGSVSDIWMEKGAIRTIARNCT